MKHRYWTLGALVLMLGLMAVQVRVFPDYGVTWDEANTLLRGENTLNWWTSGFRARGALEGDVKYYPALVGFAAHVVARVTGADPVSAQHAVILLFAWLGLGAVWAMARHLAGNAAGFFALAALALTPLYFGHGLMNPKDVPFACAFVWAVYGMMRAVEAPSLAGRWGMIAAGWCGVAMAVRSGGLILLAIFAAVSLVVMLARSGRRTWPDYRRWLSGGTLVVLVAWAVMLFFWPWAAQDPLARPLATLLLFNEHGGVLPVFYQGENLPAAAIPRTYVLERLAHLLPEYYALVPLAVLAWGWARWRGRPMSGWNVTGLGVWAGAFFIPLLLGSVGVSGRYDSMRHFLFLVPLLAAGVGVAVVGLAQLGRAAGRGGRVFAGLAGVLALISAGAALRDMVRLHPYQTIYANYALGGGVVEAARFHETDYWGLSYHEGFARLGRREGRRPGDAPLRVSTTSDPSYAAYYAARYPEWGLEAVWPPAEAEVVLHLPRPHAMSLPAGKVVDQVERLGIPLCYVIEADPAGTRWDWRLREINGILEREADRVPGSR